MDGVHKAVCPECGHPLPKGKIEGLCPRCLLAAGLDDLPGAIENRSPQQFAPPPPQVLAPHFPQLDILELIGHGGMGAVYKARQRKLNRIVALKILPAHLGAEPAFAERFTREAQALARLQHNNIVMVYDFGETAGLYFFLMEYVEGRNLRQLLQESKLRAEEALAIVPQICDALQYAHGVGVVHRDVKPENILLQVGGSVKIADFGLAKLMGPRGAEPTLTRTDQFMGTLHYMAPEQVERPGAVDHRADIYSLGVVLYEMLTGELPIGRFPPPSRISPDQERLDAIVLRSLEKEPAARYQQASEVKTALHDAQPPLPAPPEPEPALQQPVAESEPQEEPVVPASPSAPLGLGARILRPWRDSSKHAERWTSLAGLLGVLLAVAPLGDLRYGFDSSSVLYLPPLITASYFDRLELWNIFLVVASALLLLHSTLALYDRIRWTGRTATWLGVYGVAHLAVFFANLRAEEKVTIGFFLYYGVFLAAIAMGIRRWDADRRQRVVDENVANDSSLRTHGRLGRILAPWNDPSKRLHRWIFVFGWMGVLASIAPFGYLRVRYSDVHLHYIPAIATVSTLEFADLWNGFLSLVSLLLAIFATRAMYWNKQRSWQQYFWPSLYGLAHSILVVDALHEGERLAGAFCVYLALFLAGIAASWQLWKRRAEFGSDLKPSP